MPESISIVRRRLEREIFKLEVIKNRGNNNLLFVRIFLIDLWRKENPITKYLTCLFDHPDCSCGRDRLKEKWREYKDRKRLEKARSKRIPAIISTILSAQEEIQALRRIKSKRSNHLFLSYEQDLKTRKKVEELLRKLGYKELVRRKIDTKLDLSESIISFYRHPIFDALDPIFNFFTLPLFSISIIYLINLVGKFWSGGINDVGIFAAVGPVILAWILAKDPISQAQKTQNGIENLIGKLRVPLCWRKEIIFLIALIFLCLSFLGRYFSPEISDCYYDWGILKQPSLETVDVNRKKKYEMKINQSMCRLLGGFDSAQSSSKPDSEVDAENTAASESEAYFQRSLAFNPDHKESQYMLGWRRETLLDLEGAKKQYTAAMENGLSIAAIRLAIILLEEKDDHSSKSLRDVEFILERYGNNSSSEDSVTSEEEEEDSPPENSVTSEEEEAHSLSENSIMSELEEEHLYYETLARLHLKRSEFYLKKQEKSSDFHKILMGNLVKDSRKKSQEFLEQAESAKEESKQQIDERMTCLNIAINQENNDKNLEKCIDKSGDRSKESIFIRNF